MNKPTEKRAEDMNRSQRRITNNLETQTKMLNFAIRERQGKLNKILFFPITLAKIWKCDKTPGLASLRRSRPHAHSLAIPSKLKMHPSIHQLFKGFLLHTHTHPTHTPHTHLCMDKVIALQGNTTFCISKSLEMTWMSVKRALVKEMTAPPNSRILCTERLWNKSWDLLLSEKNKV